MVKVGDRVKVDLGKDNDNAETWNGEYTVVKLQNFWGPNGITVIHPTLGDGDIEEHEYTVIESK